MIRLAAPALAASLQRRLEALQKDVDSARSFEARVEKAAKAFAAQNKKGRPLFDGVKAALTSMCAGARRCNYCEDSCADEVEHLWPKKLFPERVFAWDNYCYACGGCNGPKNSRFALFKRGSAVPSVLPAGAKPFAGEPVIVDPRSEDPTLLLVLDVLETFHFAPSAGASPRERARAEYSISVLGLNREPLPKARRNALVGYVARLHWYVAEKSEAARARIREDLCATPHPTVWYEALRFRKALPKLDALLKKAPEAVKWKVGIAA